MAERLERQRRAKDDPKLDLASQAYVEFLSLGGNVRYEDLTPTLIERHLRQGMPFLTGLSATYLYGCARERDDHYDDVGGDPAGHFVVVNGYDAEGYFGREARKLDLFTQYGIVAADEALNDAGLDRSALDLDRCGVIAGSGIGEIGRAHV